MAISILQSTSTDNSSIGTTVSTSKKFFGNTQPGSFLVCIVAAYTYKNSSGVTITLGAPSTPGFNWTLATAENTGTSFKDGANYFNEAVAIYYIENAPSMASSISTSVSSSSTASATNKVSVGLIEYGGLVGTPVIQTAGATGIYPTEPGTGNVTITNTGVILVVETDTNGGASTGTGSKYTQRMGGGTEGFLAQDRENIVAGIYATAFSSLPSGYNWACVSLAVSPNPTPTIVNIVSNNGPSSGGQSVTITGTNFNSDATVTFGGVAATDVVVVSLTEITCVTPVHFPETVNVIVQESAGTATLTNGYTYVSSKIPVLYNFQDASGNPLSYGNVTFRLNTDAMTINGQQISAGILTSFTLDVNGNLVGFLWPSDQMTSDAISPNTTYRVRAYTANGQLAYEEDLVVLTP